MEETFENEIARLAALQEVDCRLKEKEELAAACAADIRDFETRLAEQRALSASLAAERDALEAERRELDARLDAEEAKIKDSRMRLNRIRNERQLLALQREIELTKEANKQLEEQLIGVMESLEAATARLADAAEALRALEAEAEREIGARRGQVATVMAEIAAIRAERDDRAKGLRASVRSKYEQIFARRGGTAVVEVRNGTCQGCHMHVPPQLTNELQKFRQICQCPSCHRILIWRPESEPQAAEG